MTMQYLGSISDFIAAIATIATLAYLALQIKHSRLSSNSTNLQNAIQDFNSINVAVGSDANLTRIVNVGASDFDSLTEAERGQYSYIQRSFLNGYVAGTHTFRFNQRGQSRLIVAYRDPTIQITNKRLRRL